MYHLIDASQEFHTWIVFRQSEYDWTNQHPFKLRVAFVCGKSKKLTIRRSLLLPSGSIWLAYFACDRENLCPVIFQDYFDGASPFQVLCICCCPDGMWKESTECVTVHVICILHSLLPANVLSAYPLYLPTRDVRGNRKVIVTNPCV